VAQNKEYLAGQDMVDGSDIIVEVTQLKVALSLNLHLVRAPLSEALHYISTSGEIIPWPRVVWVAYSWCSRDVADEGGSHHDLYPLDPSLEGVIAPLVWVGVELTIYLLHCWTRVYNDVSSPWASSTTCTLGVQALRSSILIPR
jgi:hypothetical protein